MQSVRRRPDSDLLSGQKIVDLGIGMPVGVLRVLAEVGFEQQVFDEGGTMVVNPTTAFSVLAKLVTCFLLASR